MTSRNDHCQNFTPKISFVVLSAASSISFVDRKRVL